MPTNPFEPPKEANEQNTVPSWLAFSTGGVVLTTLLYVIACGLTMGLAPRAAEGARSVVAMPWLLFAFLPTMIAGIIGFIIGLFLRSGLAQRIAFLFGVGVALFLTAGCCVDLLRRDYFGKF